MTAIIIDDERHCIDVIETLCQQYIPDMTILETFQEGAKAIAKIQQLRPDVVFLDIEMPTMNGFEFLESTPYKDFKTIFTTAYNEYAIQAIKHHAFDYLLKPIRRKELIDTIQKLKGEVSYSDNLDNLQNLLNQLATSNTVKKIPLSTQEGIHVVAIDQILYAKAESSYTNCFLTDGRKLFLSKTLKEIEETIGSDNFLRIHASYLVNFDQVAKFQRADGGYIELSNGELLPVARSRKNELMQHLESLNKPRRNG